MKNIELIGYFNKNGFQGNASKNESYFGKNDVIDIRNGVLSSRGGRLEKKWDEEELNFLRNLKEKDLNPISHVVKPGDKFDRDIYLTDRQIDEIVENDRVVVGGYVLSVNGFGGDQFDRTSLSIEYKGEHLTNSHRLYYRGISKKDAVITVKRWLGVLNKKLKYMRWSIDT